MIKDRYRGEFVKLSLIICVYNTKRHYLEECLFSIVNSTLSVRSDDGKTIDYEICLVDDGSDIDYSDLVEKYRVRYFKTENRGILSARLYGIGAASGEYMAFVDSDDAVSFNYHRLLLERAEREKSDIVIGDWAFYTETSQFYCANDSTVFSNISREENIPDLLFEKSGKEHSYYVLWNKLYRRDLLLKVKKRIERLLLPRGYNYSEDVLMNFFAYLNAERLINAHGGYYLYRIHGDQSVNVVSEQRLREQIESMSMTFDVIKSSLPPEKRYLMHRIHEWELLMSRTHYSHARALGYKRLFPLIKRAYDADVLRLSNKSDSYAYMSSRLLPDNRAKIDSSLLKALLDGVRYIRYCDDEYISSAVDSLVECGFRLARADCAAFSLPRAERPLKKRLLHNSLIYKLGNALFPKGSRVRAKIKRLL